MFQLNSFSLIFFDRLSATITELNDERQLGKALRNNQQQWQVKVSKLEEKLETKDKEVTDLQEQLRDLMFYIDAQSVIEKSDEREEIASGTITVGEAPQNKRKSKNRRKR